MTAQTRQKIITLAVPVSLEMGFQTLLGFINQVIVGTLGITTIAAIGLTNNLFFIGILCLNVLGSGTSILAAKALGSGDKTTVTKIALLCLWLALLLSSCLAIPLSVFAEGFLRLVGADPSIVQVGSPYLHLLALTLIPTVLSVVSSAVFRVIGQPRVPMMITMLTVALTPLLAWWFVLGLGMGAVGAALAGLIGQSLRALALVVVLFHPTKGIGFVWLTRLETSKLMRELLALTLPLFITEILFSSGLFLYALLVERIGTPELAAFQIFSGLDSLLLSLTVGLQSASSILVAQEIGRSDKTGVWAMSGSILQVGVMVGLVLMVLEIAAAFLLPVLYPNTTLAVQNWAFYAILFNALFLVLRISNNSLFVVLASGGDTRFLLLSDVVTVFLGGLLVSYVLAIGFGWGFWGVIAGRLIAEEGLRFAMLYWRYRTGVWFRLEL